MVATCDATIGCYIFSHCGSNGVRSETESMFSCSLFVMMFMYQSRSGMSLFCPSAPCVTHTPASLMQTEIYMAGEHLLCTRLSNWSAGRYPSMRSMGTPPSYKIKVGSPSILFRAAMPGYLSVSIFTTRTRSFS